MANEDNFTKLEIDILKSRTKFYCLTLLSLTYGFFFAPEFKIKLSFSSFFSQIFNGNYKFYKDCTTNWKVSSTILSMNGEKNIRYH
jgi:hypothetical protein